MQHLALIALLRFLLPTTAHVECKIVWILLERIAHVRRAHVNNRRCRRDSRQYGVRMIAKVGHLGRARGADACAEAPGVGVGQRQIAVAIHAC